MVTGVYFYLTLLYQDVDRWTALHTGLSWLFMNVPFLVVAQFAGRLRELDRKAEHSHVAVARMVLVCGFRCDRTAGPKAGVERLPVATFTNDELILVMISLVRATRPSMLRSEADGFTVDFEPLAKKKKLTADERLLLRMRAVMQAPTER